MATPFPSDEWIKILGDRLNNSQAYQDAATKWEGDLCFVITGLDETAYLYLDLWHGACREAYAAETAVDSEFKLSAPIATWQRVITGQLDPIRGIMGRHLKLDGPMTKILKAPKAAVELVNCAKEIDTQWP
jgi:putative sterol carrier protein